MVSTFRFEPETFVIQGKTVNYYFEWQQKNWWFKSLGAKENKIHEVERHTWGEAADRDPCHTHRGLCRVWCVGGRSNHHCHSVCCIAPSSSEANVCVHWTCLSGQIVWYHGLQWTLWQCLQMYYFSTNK